MHKINYSRAVFFVFINLGLIFSSCERKIGSTSSGKVILRVPQATPVEKMIAEITTFSSGSAPTVWSEVDCVAYMVSGPEAALRKYKCELLNGTTGAKAGDFFYGSAFAGYYMNEAAEIEVPSGENRVITALGFKTNLATTDGAAAACKAVLTQDHESFSKPFIFATSTSFNVAPGSVQTINMPINYVANNTPFVDECNYSADPGGNDQGGPPAKFRMRIQDNLSSLNLSSCVGVIFELLDANGNKAQVTDNFSYSITEATGRADFWSLNGTYCTNSPGTGTPVLNFFNGPNKFPSVILFMKVLTTGTLNFVLTQSAGSAISNEIPAGLVSYNYGTPSSEGPFRMNIFDIHSFQSTVSTSASNPIKVRAGECRPAVVQIIDNVGRPVKAGNSSGSPYTSIVDVVEGSVGVTQSSACAGLIATDSSVIVPSTYPYLLNKFYYQASVGSSGQLFKLGTSISGIGTYNPGFSLFPINITSPINSNTFWKVE